MGILDLIELDIDTPNSLPSLGVYKIGLHFIQTLFSFITMCIVASVISIERYYTGSSQAAPNYTLVVSLFSLLISIPLAIFPWSKYRNHLVPVRNFFLRPRTTVIFTCFLTFGWFAAMISMTVHANSTKNCALDEKLQKSDGGYASSWMKQCNSSKAAAAFSWLSFFLWLATAVASVILLWHEKKLRHAESSAAAAAAAAVATVSTAPSATTSNYDEDARTIVDMEFSEKEKQPVAHYDTISTEPSQPEEYTGSPEATHPLPIPPSAPPMNYNNSPFTPNAVVVPSPYAGTPITTPSFIPHNLTSPYTPQSNHITNVGSPYSLPASVASPSYPVHNSPYNTYQQQQQQQLYNQPLVAPDYQSSPLAYSSPQQFHHQPPMASYPPPQDYYN